MLAGLVLLGAAVALTDRAVQSATVPDQAIMWGGLAMAAYAYGIICLIAAVRGAGQGLRNWKFGPWMMAWCGTGFGLATLTWSQQAGLAMQIEPSSVLRALWLVAAGTTMWAIGYLAGPRRLLRVGAERIVGALRRRFSPDVRSPVAPWILYGVGIAARLVTAATTGRFGYVGNAASAVSTATGYGQVIIVLGLCAPLGVAAAALRVYRERVTSARVTLAVLFVAELAFAAASGNKQNYAVAALAVAIPFSVARYRLPKAALLVIALIFLVVVIPFTQAYRNIARGDSAPLTPAAAIGAAPGILRQTLSGRNNIVSALSRSVTYLLARNQDIDAPAIIMQRTPGQIPFASPADLVDAPLAALVPRVIWPTKPILATGYEFGQEYFGLPPTVYTSTTITPVGDLYRHGGWVAAMAGMLLLGCFVRVLDDGLDMSANPHAILLVLLLFPSLVMAEQDWITLIAGIPADVLLWMVAVAITFRRRGVT